MLKKFFHYFKSLISKKKTEENLGIVVSLTSDLKIDIALKYPKLDNYDINIIPSIAEKYAELFIYINSNVLKHKLLETIDEKSYRSSDMKEKLFFDNVLSFHDIIKKEIKKNSNTGPLISPMSVFNAR